MSVFVALFLSISLFVGQFTSAMIPHLHTPISCTANETETEMSASTTEASTSASDNSLGLSCGSAVLMESLTGEVVFSKDEHTRRSPASMTKIMSLKIIFWTSISAKTLFRQP